MRSVLLVCLLALTGCTWTSVKTADGTVITHFDVHPAGNAVSAEAVWDGVGNIKIDRDTEDSSKVAGAIAEAIIP